MTNSQSVQDLYLAIVRLLYRDQRRTNSSAQIEREKSFQSIVKIFNSALKEKEPVMLLSFERQCLNAEYTHLEENNNISKQLKSSRLKGLDEALMHLEESLRAVSFIQENPSGYAQQVQTAYGPYRKIIDPPSGDRVRKFVGNQAQRLARMNQGLRSEQEMAFFTVRQLALKTLGQVYTQLQCQALGLNPKLVQGKEKNRSVEREER